MRRTPSVDALIPALYLKGISTGDFTEALAAILGEKASGLSATNIVRLKAAWEADYKAWSQRDLSRKRYVYWWAGRVYWRRLAKRLWQLAISSSAVTKPNFQSPANAFSMTKKSSLPSITFQPNMGSHEFSGTVKTLESPSAGCRFSLASEKSDGLEKWAETAR